MFKTNQRMSKIKERRIPKTSHLKEFLVVCLIFNKKYIAIAHKVSYKSRS